MIVENLEIYPKSEERIRLWLCGWFRIGLSASISSLSVASGKELISLST